MSAPSGTEEDSHETHSYGRSARAGGASEKSPMDGQSAGISSGTLPSGATGMTGAAPIGGEIGASTQAGGLLGKSGEGASAEIATNLISGGLQPGRGVPLGGAGLAKAPPGAEGPGTGQYIA